MEWAGPMLLWAWDEENFRTLSVAGSDRVTRAAGAGVVNSAGVLGGWPAGLTPAGGRGTGTSGRDISG